MIRLLVATALISTGAQGQTFLGDSSSTLEMEQVPEAQRDLIGGEVVSNDIYPGVFYTRQGNSRCTGTLIGSQVVATAAHCVGNGGSLSLTYKGKKYSGRCSHHSEYRRNSTADWALCKLSEPVVDNIAESINTEASRLYKGLELTLMGFGCIYSGGSGGNDGKLRIGKAPIVRLPSGNNYDIVTTGNSALCYGDSGGPSFVTDSETGMRYQTAINSRGNIRSTSYLSSLHNSSVLKFYSDWSANNAVTICGLHDDAASCLQKAVELPVECDSAREDLAFLEECSVAANPAGASECQDALNNVQLCLDARRVK